MEFNKITLLILMSVWVCIGKSFAQLHRNEITLGVETFLPLANSKNVFNNSLVYRGNYMWGGKPRHKVVTWQGFTGSYMKQTPSADTFYIDTNPIDPEFIIYGEREVVQLGIKYKWEAVGKSAFNIFWAGELGMMNEKYSFEHRDHNVHDYEDLTSVGVYLAPAGGLHYSQATGFGAYAQFRYEISFTGGFYHGISFGGGLSFRF